MKRFFTSLYGQVLIGMVLGVLVGHYLVGGWWPQLANYLKPIGDVFVLGIKMVIAPLVLCTVAVGIARTGSAGKIGRVGGKALLYFEVVTTIALVLGLAAANLIQPGAGMNVDPATLDPSGAQQYIARAAPAPSGDDWLQFLINFIVHMVPGNIFEALTKGDIIQILVFAILLGFALSSMGGKADRLIDMIDDASHALLRIVGFVMKIAPLAAFAAMAFTIGKFGIETLGQLAKLIACLYGAAAVFILFVIWPICRIATGVSMWKLIKYFREELLVTLGTASSEAVMPRMLEKLETLGCSKPVVGLVIPAGYSFNLAGSSIYMTIAPLFIAQALNIHLSWQQQLSMLVVLLFTSKGIAGVAGASLVVLVTTLQHSQVLPVAGIALVLSIDRIQNEIRSVTNLIGNAVATIVIARWEGEFDKARADFILDGGIDVEAVLDSSEERKFVAPGSKD